MLRADPRKGESRRPFSCGSWRRQRPSLHPTPHQTAFELYCILSFKWASIRWRCDENFPREGLGEGKRAGEFEYDRCVCLPPCGRILFYMGTLPPLPQPDGSAAEPLLRRGAMNPSPASPVRTNAPMTTGDGAVPPHPDPPLLGKGGEEECGRWSGPVEGTRSSKGTRPPLPPNPTPAIAEETPPPLLPLPRKPFASFTRACASKRRVRPGSCWLPQPSPSPLPSSGTPSGLWLAVALQNVVVVLGVSPSPLGAGL